MCLRAIRVLFPARPIAIYILSVRSLSKDTCCFVGVFSVFALYIQCFVRLCVRMFPIAFPTKGSNTLNIGFFGGNQIEPFQV